MSCVHIGSGEGLTELHPQAIALKLRANMPLTQQHLRQQDGVGEDDVGDDAGADHERPARDALRAACLQASNTASKPVILTQQESLRLPARQNQCS